MIENQMFEESQNQAQEQVQEAQIQEKKLEKKKGYSKFIIFFLAIILIIVGVVGAYKFMSDGSWGDGYSAVFLDNNQVYFGKLSHKKSAYVTLEDVYYLRVTQVLQDTPDGKQVTVPDINLVKLGTELHKPEDRMEIQRTNILFIEKLKPESDIISAINTYKQKQKDDAAAAANPETAK